MGKHLTLQIAHEGGGNGGKGGWRIEVVQDAVEDAVERPKGWGKIAKKWVERSAGAEMDGGRFGGSRGVVRC